MLHSDYDLVAQQGLRVESVAGDFALPGVQAHRSTATMPPVDVVIIGLKTTQNRLLPDLIAHMLAHTERLRPYRTSMKIDFDAGRPLQVEAIYGNFLRAAQVAGATVPKIEMLYHLLKACDRTLGYRQAIP